MNWIAQESCIPVSNLLISLLNGVLSSVTIGIASVSALRMALHNMNPTTDHKFPAELFYCQLSFYALCIVNSVCRLVDIVGCLVLYPLFAKHALLFVYLTSYIYHWIALLAILFLRLRVVFNGTWLELRECHKTVSIGISVSVMLLYLFSYVSMAWDLIPFRANMLLVSFIVLVFLAYSLVLALTFVTKLLYLNKAKQMQRDDQALLSTMTRYTILSMISIIGSVLVILISLIIGVGGSFDPLLHLLSIGLTLDILLDALCVSLSLTFFDKIYETACHGLHDRCNDLCQELTDRSRQKTEKKITRLTLSAPSIGESGEMAARGWEHNDGGEELQSPQVPIPYSHAPARRETAQITIDLLDFVDAGNTIEMDVDEDGDEDACNPDLGDEAVNYMITQIIEEEKRESEIELDGDHFSGLYAQIVRTSTKL